MKKTFEFLLVLIIFYGVYSAFDQIIPMFAPELNQFWLVIVSLLVAAALLLLYSQVIASSIKKKVKEKMTEKISDLETQVKEKEEEVEQKDSELQDAFKKKKIVEEAAEATTEYK
ncbi:MAG: cell division protein FtsL [Candidatus Paceibacteria bacterium]|jgi:cell division protein FtsL